MYWGATGPGPSLDLLCLEQRRGAIKMLQVSLGTFPVQQVGKKRRFIIGVVLSILMSL